jgi:hypothetical protein
MPVQWNVTGTMLTTARNARSRVAAVPKNAERWPDNSNNEQPSKRTSFFVSIDFTNVN